MATKSAATAAEPTRRDFLFIATGAAGAVGVAAALWPFVSQMGPDAATIARLFPAGLFGGLSGAGQPVGQG